MPWYGYALSDHMVEPAEQILDYFVTRFWDALQKGDAIRQRREQADVNRKRKVSKKPTLAR